MKKQLIMSLMLIGSLMSVSAQAEEQSQSANSSTVKMSDVQKKDQKEADIDDEITNARLRATTGSKSKWSMSAALGYSGGPINDAFGDTRPALLSSALSETGTSLNGSVSAVYRINKNNTLNLGVGVGILKPFHESRETLGDRTQINNPGIGYSFAGRVGEIQMITSADFTTYTSKAARMGLAKNSVSFSQTALTSLGTTGIDAGVAISGDYTFYDDAAQAGDTYAMGGRTDYSLAIFPFAEYAFNDKYSLRTVFGYFNFDHYRSEANPVKLEQNKSYQSLGVGIAMSRDLYLYPNVQFLPQNLDADATNVAVSATINMF